MVDVASGSEWFELPPYTSTVTGCNTFTYEIFTDTTAAASPVGLSVDTTSGAPNIRIVPDNTHLVQVQTFYIRVKEAGGAILWSP